MEKRQIPQAMLMTWIFILNNGNAIADFISEDCINTFAFERYLVAVTQVWKYMKRD